jgi:heat-inducible transcriptional repressor
VKNATLREKDQHILYLIVENYLKNGKPVGSSHIARISKVKVSPATVRNIMVKLARNDYLSQPHTSAGRVPTDRGLRFYVNRLFEEASLGTRSLDFPTGEWGISTDDFDKLFTATSKLLSDYSDNMGFVISPHLTHLDFKHLRLIKISEEKVLILLVTTSSLVLNQVVESRHYFTQTELDRASRYINENFSGKNLSYVRDYLIKEIPQFRLKMEDTMAKLTKLLRIYFAQDEDDSHIFLQGTSKLLEKPELFDMKGLNLLFKRFEEKTKLAKLLSDVISLERVKVLIGSELDMPDICDCSLILAHYGYDHQVLGSLGIIGPKRLPYKKIIPLVNSVARHLSHTISSK